MEGQPEPAELPDGWEQRESREYQGKVFYYHAATNRSQWHPPTTAAEPKPEPEPEPEPRQERGAEGRADEDARLDGSSRADRVGAAFGARVERFSPRRRAGMVSPAEEGFGGR